MVSKRNIQLLLKLVIKLLFPNYLKNKKRLLLTIKKNNVKKTQRKHMKKKQTYYSKSYSLFERSRPDEIVGEFK